MYVIIVIVSTRIDIDRSERKEIKGSNTMKYVVDNHS